MNPYAGAVIEAIATLACRVVSRTLSEIGPRHANLIDSFVGTSLVVAGKWLIIFYDNHIIHPTPGYLSLTAFNYSGGYFNPVLATALKWGCSGHTNIEHIIVYWIGACAGAVLSVPVFNMKQVRALLIGDEATAPPKEDRKESLDDQKKKS